MTPKSKQTQSKEPQYKKIGGIIAIVISVFVLSGYVKGAWSNVDNRWTKKAEFDHTMKEVKQTTVVLIAQNKYLETRIDIKILRDQKADLQKQIFTIEDRYAGKKMPDEVKEQLRKLKADYKDAEEALDFKMKEQQYRQYMMQQAAPPVQPSAPAVESITPAPGQGK